MTLACHPRTPSPSLRRLGSVAPGQWSSRRPPDHRRSCPSTRRRRLAGCHTCGPSRAPPAPSRSRRAPPGAPSTRGQPRPGSGPPAPERVVLLDAARSAQPASTDTHELPVPTRIGVLLTQGSPPGRTPTPPKMVLPQHHSDPSSRTRQVWSTPVAMRSMAMSSGDASGVAETGTPRSDSLPATSMEVTANQYVVPFARSETVASVPVTSATDLGPGPGLGSRPVDPVAGEVGVSHRVPGQLDHSVARHRLKPLGTAGAVASAGVALVVAPTDPTRSRRRRPRSPGRSTPCRCRARCRRTSCRSAG